MSQSDRKPPVVRRTEARELMLCPVSFPFSFETFFTICCYRALAILILFLNAQFCSAVFHVLANSPVVLQACDRVGSANCTPASVKDGNTKAV